MKMIESIDLQTETERLLKYFGIIPRIKYCDSGESGNSINDIDDNQCKPCPKYALCADGNFLHCLGEKQLIDGECKYDSAEINKLQKQMEQYSISLLSTLYGECQCKQYFLYNKLYAINEDNDDDNDDDIEHCRKLSEENLSKKLAESLQLDHKSHLFGQVFDKFTNSIKEKNKTIRLAELEYDYDTGYYSNKSSKSLLCYLTIFLTDNYLIIIPVLICGTILFYSWNKRKRALIEKLRKKQLEQDRKENIIYTLKTYLTTSNQRWIPLDQIRAQCMDDQISDREWKRIEKLVDSDANVQKSVRMVDGLQKLCWKLSDTALIH